MQYIYCFFPLSSITQAFFLLPSTSAILCPDWTGSAVWQQEARWTIIQLSKC